MMQFHANKGKKKSHFPHHQLETLKGSLGNNVHHRSLVLIFINIEFIFVPGPQEEQFLPWQQTNWNPIKQKEKQIFQTRESR